MLKARREGRPIRRLSRPKSLSQHLHADFDDTTRHRQSEETSAEETLHSFAVSLSELRPRLVHLEELLPMVRVNLLHLQRRMFTFPQFPGRVLRTSHLTSMRLCKVGRFPAMIHTEICMPARLL